ncbi:hypothetical protein LLH03_20215 [bacterium]|nr:hypothetical protein [bacterium]
MDVSSAVVMVALVIVIPVVVVGGVIGLSVWLWHRRKIMALEAERDERQAEEDRRILGLGSDATTEAHLQTILDRLGRVENRLDKIEAMDNLRAAQSRTSIPITPPSQAAERRPDEEQSQRL